MSDLAIAALLGLVQGLTEFLPVSSTAHLVIAEKVFRLDPARFGLAFDVAVHLGTALAVLLYFAGTWVGLARHVRDCRCGQTVVYVRDIRTRYTNYVRLTQSLRTAANNSSAFDGG